ncbi:MAG: hypothetical protein IPH30_11620 [Betaproteobacteria bacterium]|nr:hypothetical protein [Betaproteobacteria bacterium]
MGDRRSWRRRSDALSEFRFGQSIPESFAFSMDGRHLYGSSYYTGVSNIFRYEVATGEVEAVFNAGSGSSARCRSPTGASSCSATPARGSCRRPSSRSR